MRGSVAVSHSTSLLIFISTLFSGCYTDCTFPKWLRTAEENGQSWITRRKTYSSNGSWAEQIRIRVTDDILIYENVHKQCSESASICERPVFMYNRTCERSLGSELFMVRHEAPASGVLFLCLSFKMHGKNLLQVHIGPSDVHKDKVICTDKLMVRDEWPWIAEIQREWNFCPISGGFQFHTYSFQTQEKLCPEVWLDSKVEVECMKGEGMQFEFPKKHCNPFNMAQTTGQFYCYASWEEDRFSFVALNQIGKFPNYIMRIPRTILRGKLDVYLYMRLVAPLGRNGLPPLITKTERADYYRLAMNKREASTCVDESEECRVFARKGYCTSYPPYKYANFCKRSCRLCRNDPSGQPQCRFPEQYQGPWKLYQTDRIEDVLFTDRHAFFNTLGKLVCKSKDFAENKYKVMSTYNNGCRPRYTCIEFHKPMENILQYRIGSSRKEELHFKKLCEFSDDPLPLGDRFRSRNYKILVPRKKISRVNCNIHGTIPANVTLDANNICTASVSDWDSFDCSKGHKMSVEYHQCKNRWHNEDFICIGRINPIDSTDTLILTVDGKNKNMYNCWVLHRPKHSDDRVLYRMPSPQCDGDTSRLVHTLKPAHSTYYLIDDRREAMCIDRTAQGKGAYEPSEVIGGKDLIQSYGSSSAPQLCHSVFVYSMTCFMLYFNS